MMSLMGFKPWTSGEGSDRSTIWVTTTALKKAALSNYPIAGLFFWQREMSNNLAVTTLSPTRDDFNCRPARRHFSQQCNWSRMSWQNGNRVKKKQVECNTGQKIASWHLLKLTIDCQETDLQCNPTLSSNNFWSWYYLDWPLLKNFLWYYLVALDGFDQQYCPPL